MATCLRHHVTGFGLARATMINSYLYKSIYGLTLLQSRVLWNHFIASEQMTVNYEKKHLLWTLWLLRHYQAKRVLANDVKCAPGTLMKWVWFTIDILSTLKIVSEKHVCTFIVYLWLTLNITILQVNFNKRFLNRINNQKAFLTVDGVHFKIWKPRTFSPFLFSHKFKLAGLTY